MKKRLLCFLLLLSLVLLPGCRLARQQIISLEESARRSLADAESFTAYTAEDLYDLTGIAADDYTDAVFLRDSDTLSGREIILLRAKNAATLRSAKEALEQYLSQRKEETRDYLPEAYHRLSQAKVEENGLELRLVIE